MMPHDAAAALLSPMLCHAFDAAVLIISLFNITLMLR